jgi:hypothetical protein
VAYQVVWYEPLFRGIRNTDTVILVTDVSVPVVCMPKACPRVRVQFAVFKPTVVPELIPEIAPKKTGVLAVPLIG